MCRTDKCVIVNENDIIYYDYLFLFNGEQFTYNVEENEMVTNKHTNQQPLDNLVIEKYLNYIQCSIKYVIITILFPVTDPKIDFGRDTK